MNEHQAAEFFHVLDAYVRARIAVERSRSLHPATQEKRSGRLVSAASDLKEKLRDLTVETIE